MKPGLALPLTLPFALDEPLNECAGSCFDMALLIRAFEQRFKGLIQLHERLRVDCFLGDPVQGASTMCRRLLLAHTRKPHWPPSHPRTTALAIEERLA